MKNNILLLLLASIFLIACQNEVVKNDKTEESSSQDGCEYSLINKDLKLEWTAFKMTEKIAVKGSFDKIIIDNEIGKSNNLEELIKYTTFTLFLETVNSGNQERDSKLISFFFNKFTNNKFIKGNVIVVDQQKGKIDMNLKLNNIEKEISLDFSFSDNIIHISGDLDLLDWKIEEPIATLNEACEAKHTGEDGITKTWSEMHIEFSIPVRKECK